MRKTRTYRPSLEVLEGRINPAMFFPTTEAELKADVVTANGNDEADVIDLAGQTITLTSEQFGLSGLFVDLDNGNPASTLTIQNGTISRSMELGTPRFRVVRTDGPLNLSNVTIQNGFVEDIGGGVVAFGADAILNITDSTISNNIAVEGEGGGDGGGVAVAFSASGTITNSTISGNSAEDDGGGVFFRVASTAEIYNSTISNNFAGTTTGGGVFTDSTGTVISSTIIANNTSGTAPDLFDATTGAIIVTDSLIETADGHTVNDGVNGNIVGQDPNTGPLQNNGGSTETHALLAGSPAIDQGNNNQNLANDQRRVGFARVVNGQADIGAFEVQANGGGSLFAVGQDPGLDSEVDPIVKVYNADGTLKFRRQVFEARFRGGVRVATGDVNGDGTDDIIVGAGVGGGPRVRVIDGDDGSFFNGPLGSFFAFDETFRGGIFVATGDVNGDNRADVIVSQDSVPNAGIRVFDGVTGQRLLSFTSGLPSQGARIATGDVDGDNQVEIIVGSGVEGTSTVRVFDGRTARLESEFLPFGGFTGGIYVSAGDTNGDGVDEIIVGTGAGSNAVVRVFDARQPEQPIGGFIPFQSPGTPTGTGSELEGARVGVIDVDGDGNVEILVGRGPARRPIVEIYEGVDPFTLLNFFDAFATDLNAGEDRGFFVG